MKTLSALYPKDLCRISHLILHHLSTLKSSSLDPTLKKCLSRVKARNPNTFKEVQSRPTPPPTLQGEFLTWPVEAPTLTRVGGSLLPTGSDQRKS